MIVKNVRFLLFSALLLAFETVTAQIPNNGFESWEIDPYGNLNPSGWETTNDDPDISVEQYIPAKQGNYSIRVKVPALATGIQVTKSLNYLLMA
jgi:hypothetical protein